MTSRLFEMGKEAGKAISRSARIQLGKPGGNQKAKDALQGKSNNNSSPWRLGRKPAKRKKAE